MFRMPASESIRRHCSRERQIIQCVHSRWAVPLVMPAQNMHERSTAITLACTGNLMRCKCARTSIRNSSANRAFRASLLAMPYMLGPGSSSQVAESTLRARCAAARRLGDGYRIRQCTC